MSILKKLGTIISSLIIAGCVNNTTVRQHEDWSNRQKELKTITIATKKINVVEKNMTGDGDREKEIEEMISNHIKNELPVILEIYGYKASPIAEQTLNDQGAAYSLTELGKTYESAKKDSYKEFYMPKEKALACKHTVGENAAEIAALSNSQAILLVEFNGYTLSGGQVAKEIFIQALTGAQAQSGNLTLDYALIDGESGDILCSNIMSAPGGSMGMTWDVNALSSALIKDMLTLSNEKKK